MRYRCLAILLLLCGTFLSTGCNGSKETDEIAYIIGMGIDAADDNKIDVTYRIAIPRNIGMGGGGGGGGAESNKTSEVITIRVANLVESRSFLTSIISRSPRFSQLKTIGVGEALARKGVYQFLEPTNRYQEFRGSMIFVVVKGSARDFMTQNKPTLETLPSKYYETQMLNAPDTSYFLHTTLHDFYEKLKSNSSSPYAALFGVNPLDGLDQPSATAVPPLKADQYLAGFIPRRGGNPVETLGTAIFCKDKMVGVLTNQETRMLAMLSGTFPGAFMAIQDPWRPQESVNVRLRLMKQPKITVGFINKLAIIKVKVSLEGEITAIPSGINYESQYQQDLENQISLATKQSIDQLVNKTQGLGSDVVGFGNYARSSFSSFDDFMAMKWDEVYPQAVVEVEVTTQIRRTGLMQQTAPIR